MSQISTRNRFRGCLLGLAAGDALGTTLEFKKRGTFESIDDIVGGGHSTWRPASGPTTRPWPCAWPRALSKGTPSIPRIRCSAMCDGFGRATYPLTGTALTSETPYTTP